MDPDAQRQRQSAGCAAPMIGRRDLISPNPKLKLLDQVREVMRLKHYSIRTEKAYCDWIRRYVKFHGMQSREELRPAAAKMELFLSDLAAKGKVAASTQNQAFNALLFLYREVVHHPLGLQDQATNGAWRQGVSSALRTCRQPWDCAGSGPFRKSAKVWAGPQAMDLQPARRATALRQR